METRDASTQGCTRLLTGMGRVRVSRVPRSKQELVERGSFVGPLVRPPSPALPPDFGGKGGRISQLLPPKSRSSSKVGVVPRDLER